MQLFNKDKIAAMIPKLSNAKKFVIIILPAVHVLDLSIN